MTLRVMIVEDSKRVADRLSAALDGLDSVCVTSVEVSEAAAVAAIATTRPDVVTLDLRLADGSGFGVLRHFAAEERPRFLVFSNHVDPALRRRAEALGAAGFFDKASDVQILLDVVARIAQTSGTPDTKFDLRERLSDV